MSNLILNNIAWFDYNWRVGYNFKTDITQLGAGGEQRRSRWSKPLRKFTLPYGNKSTEKINALMTFFRQHKGMYESFYFFNPCGREAELIDSEHQLISGGKITTLLLLEKPVIKASYDTITIINSTNLDDYGIIVKQYVNGAYETIANNKMTIDPANGYISITNSGDRPAENTPMTVEYDYLVKVRFATDLLELTEAFHLVANTSIELIEVR